jgi:DNA-binding NtrC family response regulator
MNAIQTEQRLNQIQSELIRTRALINQRLGEIETIRVRHVTTAAIGERIDDLRAEAGIVPLELLEKQAILRAVELKKVPMAAKMLGIGRTTLYRKLAEYGFDVAAMKKEDAA